MSWKRRRRGSRRSNEGLRREEAPSPPTPLPGGERGEVISFLDIAVSSLRTEDLALKWNPVASSMPSGKMALSVVFSSLSNSCWRVVFQIADDLDVLVAGWPAFLTRCWQKHNVSGAHDSSVWTPFLYCSFPAARLGGRDVPLLAAPRRKCCSNVWSVGCPCCRKGHIPP